MTKDRYLTMCEQLGQEPNLKEIPPDYEDFPDIVIYAMNAFSMLQDRMYPDVGYIGKDYTNLPIYMEALKIEDKELFLEILDILDSRAVEHSRELLKKERDKLKRKR